MKSNKLILFLSVAVLLCGGCAKKNQFEGKSPEEAKRILPEQIQTILNGNSSPQDKADMLAELGETALEVPSSSMTAIVAFEESLKLDSQNGKSNFYSAILMPVLSFQGFSVRIADILTPKETESLTSYILNQIGSEEIRGVVSSFLKDQAAGNVFKTPTEVQQFLKELLPVLEESKKRLEIASNHPGFNLTFNYANWGNKRIFGIGGPIRTTVSLNSVEAESAKSAITTLSIWLKMLAAYNLDDAIAIRDKYISLGKDALRNITFKRVVDELKQYPKLLTLNADGASLLKSARDDISGALDGIKVVSNMLSINNGERNNYLVPDITRYEQYLACRAGSCVMDDVLSGPYAVSVGQDVKEAGGLMIEKLVLLNGAILFHQPISDFKALLPTAFDSTGRKARAIPDVTFGGIVPNGDLIRTYCSLTRWGKPDKRDFPVDCTAFVK